MKLKQRACFSNGGIVLVCSHSTKMSKLVSSARYTIKMPSNAEKRRINIKFPAERLFSRRRFPPLLVGKSGVFCVRVAQTMRVGAGAHTTRTTASQLAAPGGPQLRSCSPNAHVLQRGLPVRSQIKNFNP